MVRNSQIISTGAGPSLENNVELDIPTVSVAAGNATITVTFLSDLIGFEVQYIDISTGVPVIVPVEAGVASYEIGGLVNGASYAVGVAAVTEVGRSDYTEPVTVTPLAAPTAPTALQGKEGNEIIDLSWNFTTDPNVTHFLIYRDGDAAGVVFRTIAVSAAPGNTYRVTGLQNRTQYSLRVGTVNVNGTKSAGTSSSVALTPIGVPLAPTAPVISSSNDAVTVTWTRSANEADTVLEYVAEIYVDGDIASTQIVSYQAAASVTYTAAALNGKSAYARILAQNATFASAAVQSATIVVRPAPSVTAITAVDSGDGECTVRWNSFVPAASYIDSFFLEAYLGGVLVRTRIALWNSVDGGAVPTQQTVTGLTNGALYSFKVGATNTSSPVATFSDPVSQTPYPSPPTVTGVAAAPGLLAATVSWTLPGVTTFVSSLVVEAYTVSLGVETIVRTVTDIAKTSTSVVVTGLTANILHYFRVKSTNPRFPSGVASASVGQATPRNTPTAVTGLAVVEGDTTLAVSWNAVSGGNTDSYTVSWTRVGAEGTEQTQTGVTGTSYTVTGLTNGEQYSVRVRAVNNVTVGEYSTPLVRRPLPDPAPPTALAVTDGVLSLGVTWTASTTAVALLDRYVLYVRNTTAGVDLTPIQISKTAISYTLEGLLANNIYSLELSAQNTKNGMTESAKAGPATGTAYPALAGSPTIDTVATVAGNARVTVVWEIAESDMDASIDGFNVEVSTAGQTTRTLTVDGRNTRSVVVGDGSTAGGPALTNNVTYSFRVRKKNPVIGGDWSSTVTRKPLAPPPAPTGLVATAGVGNVSLAWTEPADLTYVYKYVIEVTAGGVAQTPIVIDSGVSTRLISGLTNGVAHSFTIRSRNDIFDSAVVGPATATPLAVPPAVPAPNLTAIGGDMSMSLTWVTIGMDTTYVAEYSLRLVVAATEAAVSTVTVPVAGPLAKTFTGLTNGIGYKIYIKTRNAVTESAETVSDVVTPKPPPPVVSILNASAGIDSVTVSWYEPTPTTYISTYSLQRYKDNAADGAPISFSVGDTLNRTFGLTGDRPIVNGSSYYFTVQTVNEWYSSALTTSPTVVPLGKPAAIEGFAVDASDARVVVRWNALSMSEAEKNTQRLRVDVALEPVSPALPVWVNTMIEDSTQTTIDISGLENQSTYLIRMRGENSLSGGFGDYTSELTRRPRARPATSTAMAITGGAVKQPGKATITWAQSDAGSGAIDNYEIRVVPVGGGTAVTATAASNQAGFYVMSGLTNGVEYYATVRAYNNIFTSAIADTRDSATDKTFTPLDYPASVAGLAVAPGNTELSVTWTAAASSAATAVTGYKIKYQRSGFADVIVDVPGRTTVAKTLTGLVNNIDYSVSIVAYNAYYEGQTYSSAVVGRPRGVPVAPVAGTLVGDDGKAHFTWTDGAGVVAADIDKYIVTAESDNLVEIDPPIDYSILAGTRTLELIGLTNGNTYTVRIRAVNMYAGALLFQSAVISAGTVKPLGVPTQPTGFAVDASDTRVIVRWTPPDDGTITGYKVRWDVAGGSTYKYLNVTSATVATVDVSGLVNNTGYEFSIASYNTNKPPNGESLYVTPLLAVTPRGRPVAPVAGTLVAGDGQATLSWTDGAGVVAADIDKYVVVATAGAEVKTYETMAGTRTVTLTGLTNGTTYTVTVRSQNNVFQSANVAAGTVLPLGPPLAVTGMVVDPSNAIIVVSWDAATASAATAVSGYQIEYTTGGTSVVLPVSGRATTTATITGLTNGTSYSVRMRAVNAIGTGPYNTAVGGIIPRGYPSAPVTVTLTAGVEQIVVGWTFSGVDADVDGFVVVYTPNGGASVTKDVVDATLRTTTLTGVTNGTTYTIGVYAYNRNSRTTAVLFQSATTAGGTATPLDVPATPAFDLAATTATEGSVTLTWTISSTANLASFVVTQGGVELTGLSLGAAARTTTITGLTNGTAYSFTVTAVNTNKTRSSASEAVIRTPRRIPANPLSLTGLADISEVTLEWAIAAGTGDPPLGDLDQYRIEMYEGATVAGGVLRETVDISAAALGSGSADFPTLRNVRFIANGHDGNTLVKPPPLTFRLTTLVNGITYTFRLRTRNLNGDYSAGWSVTVTLTPVAVPPQPTITSASASDGTITVNWSATGNNLVQNDPKIEYIDM
jgi:titin